MITATWTTDVNIAIIKKLYNQKSTYEVKYLKWKIVNY